MKKDNKGFSLVELIIVIAIMAVLVGVLAPQFIKYVEQSRRSRDITTANEIREAVLADIADSNTASLPATGGAITNTSRPTTISETPKASAKAFSGSSFTVSYDISAGTCSVFVSGFGSALTTEEGASAYKNSGL